MDLLNIIIGFFKAPDFFTYFPNQLALPEKERDGPKLMKARSLHIEKGKEATSMHEVAPAGGCKKEKGLGPKT